MGALGLRRDNLLGAEIVTAKAKSSGQMKAGIRSVLRLSAAAAAISESYRNSNTACIAGPNLVSMLFYPMDQAKPVM